MRDKRANKIVFVCDDGTTSVDTPFALSLRMGGNKMWVFDGINLGPRYDQPVFDIEHGLVIDYMTLGLALKCGFNTIFVRKEKRKIPCVNSLFKKEYIANQEEGKSPRIYSLLKLNVSRGYPIRRSSYIKADFDLMSREADAFEDGRLILNNNDMLSVYARKQIKPIMNFTREIVENGYYYLKFCSDAMSKISEEHRLAADLNAQYKINRGELYAIDKPHIMYNLIVEHFSNEYGDMFQKLYDKHQKMYLEKMKKLFPHPIF